jgi:alpha-beta hydrolase superfamily lysophospholipase
MPTALIIGAGIALLALVLWGARTPTRKPRQPQPAALPPDQTSAIWREWEVAPGIRGYAWEVPQPRAIVLLQHGYADYALRFVSEYHQLIPRLCDAGISVYAFDLWGHGYSAGQRGVLDVRQAVADHMAARQLLHKHPQPLFLIGHSLGGLITAASLLTDHTGVAGVIMMSPALPHRFPAPLRGIVNLLARIAPHRAIPLPGAPEAGLSRDTDYIARATADPLIYHAQVPLLVAASALAVAADLDTRYHTWHTPTLIQHGDADSWAAPQASTRLAELIDARAQCTLHIYPDGRHNLLCDHDQARVYADIHTWLEERISSAS